LAYNTIRWAGLGWAGLGWGGEAFGVIQRQRFEHVEDRDDLFPTTKMHDQTITTASDKLTELS
jgi:hypothetical protein